VPKFGELYAPGLSNKLWFTKFLFDPLDGFERHSLKLRTRDTLNEVRLLSVLTDAAKTSAHGRQALKVAQL
jgi:hypothetical protein